MAIGDGIDSTIETGKDGTTTFRSATFGTSSVCYVLYMAEKYQKETFEKQYLLKLYQFFLQYYTCAQINISIFNSNRHICGFIK